MFKRWQTRVAAGLVAAAIISVAGAVLIAEQWAQTLRDGAQRVHMDTAQAVLDARLAQWREQLSSATVQLATEPLLRRALQSDHRDALEGLLMRALKKSGAQRAMLIGPSAGIRLEAVAPGTATTSRVDSSFASALQKLLRESQRLGVLTQVVLTDNQQAWLTAMAAIPGESLHVVLISDLGPRVLREGQALGLKSTIVSASGASAPDERRIFIGDAYPQAAALSLAAKGVDAQTGLHHAFEHAPKPWLSLAGLALVLGALLSAVFLWTRRPAQQLRQVAACLRKPPEQLLRSLSATVQDAEWQPVVHGIQQLCHAAQVREKQWQKLASLDSLTALPNALRLQEHLAAVLKQAREASVAVSLIRVDIEAFRAINSSLGYPAGDQLIRDAADRIRSLLRGSLTPARLQSSDSGADNDGMPWKTPAVARLGADDFVVVMPDCPQEQAQRVASRIGEALSQPFVIDGQPTRISVHLGIANFPEHGQDATALLQAAETALLVGRENKRRIAVFDIEHETERERRVGLLAELRRALDGNELRLVYQPKVALHPDPQLRVEALIRWEHPERGLQNPADFIGFAERTGFIRELTAWVIDHSLRQIVQWRAQGMDVQVGVNLSIVDIRSPDLATTVIERLRHYKLPPNCLTVEISQASLELEHEETHACLRILDRFGVKLALDDFTGGVAALALLERLPVQTVKLERAMLAGLPEDTSRQVLVKACISLAHYKGLQVMAEGVEDAVTLSLLRGYGCDFAQGYYFGKPLASDALHAWVDHQMRRFQPQPPTHEIATS